MYVKVEGQMGQGEGHTSVPKYITMGGLPLAERLSCSALVSVSVLV